MKNHLFLVFAISILFSKCSSKKKLNAEMDNERASVQLLSELAPQLTGTWALKEIQISPRFLNGDLSELGIRKDTLFHDFGTLTLTPVAYQPTATQCRYEGLIRMGDKTCPVKFSLIAGPWLFKKAEPQGFLLLEYDFPIRPVTLLPEHIYLRKLGIVDEVFSLETSIGQPTMVWRGRNQQVKEIQFVKQ